MRATALMLLWAAASTVAIIVAWQGVSVVDNHVIHPPSVATELGAAPSDQAASPAGADFVAQVPTAPSSARTPVEPTPAATPVQSPSATPTVSSFEIDFSLVTGDPAEGDDQERSPEPVGESSDPVVAPPEPDRSPSARPEPTPRPNAKPSPERTPRPKPTATPRPKPPAPTPKPTPASEQVLVFNLVGGSTAIAFGPGTVHVMWASPAPGYTVEVGSEPPGIMVDFRGDDERSRIDAWWNGGPQWDIREED